MSYTLPTLLAVVLCAFSCVPISQNTTDPASPRPKTMAYDNKKYEHSVSTVQVHGGSSTFTPNSFNAVTPLGRQSLYITFDILKKDVEKLNAKIFHCNANWEKSSYRNLDYLDDFNEFNVNDYQFSFDTKVPYVHYKFNIPRVKISGNYILAIYRNGNEHDLILTRRFMVYDNNVVINTTQVTSGAVTTRRKTQQIDFNISYGNYDIVNPMRTLAVNVRQNQRWDNAKISIQPKFLNEGQKMLQYRFFEPKEQFMGGNEYRFFDLRSLRYPGQNVFRVDTKTVPITAYLMKDEVRSKKAYAQYNDINGSFIIENRDTGNEGVEANYVDVRFTLASEKLNQDVYILGALTDWQTEPRNRLNYDPATKTYTGSLLLKQGWYDYQYYVDDPDSRTNVMEGDHSDTENQYEIFVYYRPLNARGDLLIGYKEIQINVRDGINR